MEVGESLYAGGSVDLGLRASAQISQVPSILKKPEQQRKVDCSQLTVTAGAKLVIGPGSELVVQAGIKLHIIGGLSLGQRSRVNFPPVETGGLLWHQHSCPILIFQQSEGTKQIYRT